MDPHDLIGRVRRGLAAGEPERLLALALERGLLSADGPGLAALTPDQIAELRVELRRRDAADVMRLDLGPAPEDVRAASRDSTRDLGRYVLVRAIGRGGSAEVWSAWDRDLQRRVAVKLLFTESANLQAARRFQREASVAGQIRHPNIVAVHDMGEWNQKLFLVMDLIEGGDLSRWIATHAVPPARIAELVEKVARAIHEAHGRGIIHRDLKPSNVLMDERGEPVVSDFGLALWEMHHDRMTVQGGIVGTPPYMAAEQFLGRKIDARTDVYSLGVLLYEILAGELPFRSKSMGDLMRQVEAGDADPPSRLKKSVPSDLDAICMKAMSRYPAERYPTALEMADDLRRFREGEPVHARPQTRTFHMMRWTRRHGTTVAIALVVVIAAAVGGVAMIRSSMRAASMHEIQRAAVAYREGRLDEAQAAAGRAVDRDPNLAEGHFWLGRVQLRRYMAHWKLPTPWRLFVGLEFGEASPETEAARGIRLGAERAFAAIPRRSSEGWEGPCSQGMLDLLKGRYPEAERGLSAARRHPSMSPDREVDALYALSLYYQKRFTEALAALRAIPPPYDPFTSVALARASHGVALEQESRGESPVEAYDCALASCDRASSLSGMVRTSRAMYLDRRGSALASDEIEAVIAEFAARERQPEDRIAMALSCMLGAQVARHAMRFDRRKELLDRALEEIGQVRGDAGISAWVEAALRVARLDLDRDFDVATAAVDRASRLLGPVPDVLQLEAQMIALRQAGPDGARRAYDHLVIPKDASPDLYAQRGNFAMVWLNRAEEEGVDDPEAEAAARDCYGQCLRRDPTHLGALAGLGNSVLSLARRQVQARRIKSETVAELQGIIDRMPGSHSGKHLDASLSVMRAWAEEFSGGDPTPHQARALQLNCAMLAEGGCDLGSLAMAAVDTLQREKAWRVAAGRPLDSLLPRIRETRATIAAVKGDGRVALALAMLDMVDMELGGGGEPLPRFRAVLEALGPVVDANPRQLQYVVMRAQYALTVGAHEELGGGDPVPYYERTIADASWVLEARPGEPNATYLRMSGRLSLAERKLRAGELDTALVNAALDDVKAGIAFAPEPWRVRFLRSRVRVEAATLSRKDRGASRAWLKDFAEDLEGALAVPAFRRLALETRIRGRLLEVMMNRDASAAAAGLKDLAELGADEPFVVAHRGMLRAWSPDGTRADHEAALADLIKVIALGVKREGLVDEAMTELEKLLR